MDRRQGLVDPNFPVSPSAEQNPTSQLVSSNSAPGQDFYLDHEIEALRLNIKKDLDEWPAHNSLTSIWRWNSYHTHLVNEFVKVNEPNRNPTSLEEHNMECFKRLNVVLCFLILLLTSRARMWTDEEVRELGDICNKYNADWSYCTVGHLDNTVLERIKLLLKGKVIPYRSPVHASLRATLKCLFRPTKGIPSILKADCIDFSRVCIELARRWVQWSHDEVIELSNILKAMKRARDLQKFNVDLFMFVYTVARKEEQMQKLYEVE